MDGIVHCQVLEVKLHERLVYNWTGGSDDNAAYGSPLDTVVTWTLTPVEGGTRLRLVHSGYRSPENDFAFNAMSGGWGKSCDRSAGLPASGSGDRDRAWPERALISRIILRCGSFPVPNVSEHGSLLSA
jgi:Activator of Hsp90 ATPase homolog 1-like protein